MADPIKLVATNRKARHEYHIEETIEAGLALKGTEVKSLREGRVNLQDAYCAPENGEMYLYNCHISPYRHTGAHDNHDPLRPRKLLMHRREILRWTQAAQQKGYTIIPLSIYFKKGKAKVELALARGKKLYDRRADIAEREARRRLERVLKGRRG